LNRSGETDIGSGPTDRKMVEQISYGLGQKGPAGCIQGGCVSVPSGITG